MKATGMKQGKGLHGNTVLVWICIEMFQLYPQRNLDFMNKIEGRSNTAFLEAYRLRRQGNFIKLILSAKMYNRT